mgnify:CR=1 FL=1
MRRQNPVQFVLTQHSLLGLFFSKNAPPPIAISGCFCVCADFISGSDDGGPPADDPLLAQYLSHYKVQLPGLDFYDDAYHALLTLDG